MTAPDPDETPRPETPRRSDDAGLSPGTSDARRFEMPDDVDAAFAEIVADWADSDAPRWPQDPNDEGPSSGVGLVTPPQGQPESHPERRDDLFDVGPTAPGPHSPGHPVVPGQDSSVPERSSAPEPPHDPSDEHFVPPEPPPLPRLGWSSLLGLLLLVAGVVLLALPAVVGGGFGGMGIVPGLLAMTAGLGWLVVGMRRPGEDDS